MNIYGLKNQIEFEKYFQFTEKDWKSQKNYQNLKISNSFLSFFKNKLNWSLLFLKSQVLNLEQLEKYHNRINWRFLCYRKQYSYLPEEFYEKYFDKLDTVNLSIYNKNLSNQFFIRHKNSFDWKLISAHQKLSLETIKIMKNKLDKENIYLHQIHLDKKLLDEIFNS